MRILIVAPDIPFPPNHGGRLDVWDQIKVLANLNYEIDLVYTFNEKTNNTQILEIHKKVSNIWGVKRTKYISDLLSLRSFQISSRRELKNVNLSNQFYDLVILETEYVAEILNNKTLAYRKLALRVQNDESYYFYQLSRAEKSILRKIIFALDAKSISKQSLLLFRRVNTLLFISQKDLNTVILQHPELLEKSIFAPPPVELSMPKIQIKFNSNVVFVGSLFMPNNQDAIEWYIHNVHELIKKPGYRLIVAGNSRGGSIEWLKNLIKNFKNIDVFDSPEDLDQIYSNSKVFINPMRYGSGIKMKTIHALINGLPVVSSTIGVEGTGLIDNYHVMISDEPSEFAKKVDQLLSENEIIFRMIENTFDYLTKNYNFAKNIESVLKEV